MLPEASPPPGRRDLQPVSEIYPDAYRDTPVDDAKRLALRLLVLLNRPAAKIVSPFNLDLDGPFVETNIDHVVAHLNGDIALTFSVLEGHRASGFASFIGWDIDVYAPFRISVLKRVLEAIDPRLVAASFATDGSAADKGKVILTLEEPIPARSAHRFAREIRRRCLQQSDFGHVGAADFEERPRNGAGGLLRIGGRNLLKGAVALESFLDLDGLPNDLMNVTPIARDVIDAITFELTQYGAMPLTWLNDHLHTPWRYDTVTPPDTRGIIRRVAASDPPIARIDLVLPQRAPRGRIVLVLHEDDLGIESLPLDGLDVVAVAALAPHAGRAPAVEEFARGALDDALARARLLFGVPEVSLGAAPALAPLAAPYAPIGPTRDALEVHDVAWIMRTWDARQWPLARGGYFAFRERAAQSPPGV